ncbi:hypothetical protein CYLTODRAFT_337246, partial [Cylindrobasidium torrendii FP15055 ss-10]
LISFRDRFVTGQGKGTRSRTLIEDVTDRLNAAVLRFNTSCAALLSLTDEKSALPRMRKRVRGHDTGPDDEGAEAEPDPAALASAAPREGDRESRRVMNWIWTAKGAPDSDEDTFLHDAVRVEWCKAYARKQRWGEEVIILLEEQRRAIESIHAETRQWEARETATSGGRAAYAHRQVLARKALAAQFT